jgi:hypothetical protein
MIGCVQLVRATFWVAKLKGVGRKGITWLKGRRRLEGVISRSRVQCLRLVEAFEDGEELVAAAERHKPEGIVSKRTASPYRSGESRG